MRLNKNTTPEVVAESVRSTCHVKPAYRGNDNMSNGKKITGDQNMSISKAWEWNEEKNQIWLTPSEESYFISNRWKNQGFKLLLDFGCGLGRHSIYFAGQGFNVSAFDLSEDGTKYLCNWAKKENLNIDVTVADMLSLPYSDETFDCLFGFHVISHTDTTGIKIILNEVKRVIKPQGEIY